MSDAGAFSAYTHAEIHPGVHQFRSRRRGCNCYLLVGRDRIVLVDTGLDGSFPDLRAGLKVLGYAPGDVDLVLLTHEHFDQISASSHFAGRSILAAHRLAANRIVLDDDFATIRSVAGGKPKPFRVDLWLEEGNVIDVPPFRLEVLHTPGHTSGSVSFYDRASRMLLSGDTVMADGVMGGIFGSGNISDYIQSLERLSHLRVGTILPGHGPVSEVGEADIERARARSAALLGDTRHLFDALGKGSGWRKILSSVRDLNR